MQKPPKVLVVDDEVIYTDIFTSVLKKNGYGFTIGRNGHEALEKLGEGTTDLIILDIMMPGIDGFETCRRVRNDVATQDIPIIMVTAQDNNEFKLKGLEAGANDFLHKPVDTLEMMIRVKNLLKMKDYQDTLKWNIGMLETEVARRMRTEMEKEKLIADLRDAIAKIKILNGLLPICSSCKKIRDDQGYWKQIDAYICEHTDTEFSHGICPDCAAKLYPQYYKNM